MASNIPDWAKESSVPEWAREKPAPTRNIAAVANDWVIEAANAIAGTVGAVSEFVSPGNRFAKGVEELVRKGEESQSDVTKQSKQRMRQGLEQAEGFGQEAGIVGQYLLESPGLAAAQALGSFAGPGLAVRGAARAAGGLAAGRATAAGATAAEAAARGAQVGSRVGLGAGAVVSGAAAGGDAAGNAYDLVMRAPDEVLSVTPEWKELAASLPPEQIKEQLATAAARDGSILPAIVGAVTGAFGAEKLIAGTPAAKIIGQATSRKGAALRTGLTEATQEGFEEGITQYEGQRAASQYDLTIDPMQGVGGAATMGAALGGIAGGVIGGVVGPERAAPAPAPTPANPDAQLDRSLDQLQRARDEVYLGGQSGAETVANVVAAPDLNSAIEAAEASVPSMQQLMQDKRLAAAKAVADQLGIEPATNFPTIEQALSDSTPGLQPGQSRLLSQPSVLPGTDGTPGLQPGQTRILTQPSVFAEPSASTPGLEPGQTRILTQPSVFADSDSTPGLQPGQRLDTPAPPATPDQTRLNTAQAGVDRDVQLLAQRDGTPAPQPPAKMLQDAQRLEESARLIESNPRAPEAVLQRAQALREQAQALRARAEEAAASAPAEQPGAGIQFEREQIDAQRQINQDKRLPSRQDAPAAGYADLAPMDERTARGRLKVLRDQAANEGGDALGLQVVPHPNTPGKFAIAKAELPSLDMPAAAAPAPVTQQEAGQRLEAAAAKAPTDADAMIEALKVRDTGQAVGGQLLDMLSPGDRLVYSNVLRAVEARDGKASPLEAALLDRVNPGGKNYDSLIPAPLGGEQLRTLRGLTQNINALGDAQQQGKDAAGEQLRLNALVRQGERAQGIEQPRAGRPLETIAVETKSPAAGGVKRAGALDRRTGEQRSDDAVAAMQKNTLLKQISQSLANLFPQQKTTEAPDVGLIDRVLRKTGALRNAAEKLVVDGARKILTPAQFDILQRAALNPASLGAVERLQLRRMREGDFKFSEQREETNVAPEATQQGKPVSTLGNITTVDPATLQTQSRTSDGTISRQTHRLVSLIASMFGKKVVVFASDNDMAPDGFVRRGDSKTIHLNVNSGVSHLVVFGHELLHQLKADNPQAYAALMKVIKLEEGTNTDVAGIRGDMEELTADIVGNRFRETEFWRDVFREILASGTDAKVSQRSAMRLGASVVRAVDRMVKALKGMTGFNTDNMVANLGEVKAAVTKALASYAQEKRGEATELIRQEVAGQQAPAADTTGEVVASEKRGQLDNVEAYHFSKGPRKTLISAMYGTGLKGSGADEYKNATDERRRHRIYFYVDKGTGIKPEAGVGGAAHKALLDNVYDVNADPLKLKAGTQAKTETAILDAGFDGYLDRMEGTQSGNLIMLGQRAITVQPMPPGTRVTAGKVVPGEDSQAVNTWKTYAAGVSKDDADATLARLQGKPGWRGYELEVTSSGNKYEIRMRAREEDVVSFSQKRGDLKGLPAVVKVDGKDVRFGAFEPAHQAAEAYMRDAGLEYMPPTEYVKVDPVRAKRIAKAYGDMQHAPGDPAVKRAYEALAREVVAQYKAVLNTGLIVEFNPGQDPYGNPRNAILDVVENNHLFIFSTEEGYGQDGITAKDRAENPMLADSGYKFGDRPALVNDLFRVVHDYFGHIKDGVGFRADGEENAWRSHAAMFTPLARQALTSETRGQNSDVNFGPNAEFNKTASGGDTVYADQKIGLMPEWTWEEGRTSDEVKQSARRQNDLFLARMNSAQIATTSDFWRTWQNFMVGRGTQPSGLSSVASDKSNKQLIADRVRVFRGEADRYGIESVLRQFSGDTGAGKNEDGTVAARVMQEILQSAGIRPTFENAVAAYNSLEDDSAAVNDGPEAEGPGPLKLKPDGRVDYGNNRGVLMRHMGERTTYEWEEGEDGIRRMVNSKTTEVTAANDLPPGVFASAKRRKTQEAGVEVPTTVDGAADSTAAFKRARGKVFETNRELKTEIQDAVRAAAEDAGVDLSTFSEETEKYLVRVATAEAVKALRENANAIGWYREKVTKALRIAALKHPELNTNPESRMVFIWALAVTSNGMRVKKNFELADKAYSSWKRYGKFPVNIGQGTAKKAINNGLRAYNVLSKKMTFDQLHDAMLTKSPVAQIGKLLGIKPSGEYADTIVYGSAILGPKVGNGFFANLYGHYEQLTIDRWLMRTWGRWTGTLVEVKTDVVAKKADTLSALLDLLTAEQRTQLEQAIGRTVYLDDLEPTASAISAATVKESVRDALDEVGPLDKAMRARVVDILGKEKANSKRVSLGDEIRKAGMGLHQAIDGQVEAPRDPQQRNDMRKVFDQVLAELQKSNPGLTMSDLQAVLWYPEKRIYDAAKTDKETDDGYEDGAAPDYANAAAEHYRGRGVAKSAIDRVIAQVDSELQAADGAGRGGRGAGGVAQQPGGVSDPSIKASEKRTYILLHGGSDFDTIDKRFLGSGEPGNLRPLGPGFYGYLVRDRDMMRIDDIVRMTKAYTKYAPTDKRAVHAFKLTLEPGEVYFAGRVWDEDLLTPEQRQARDDYGAANDLPPGPERRQAYSELEKKYPPTGETARRNNRAVTTEVLGGDYGKLSSPEYIEAQVQDTGRLDRIGKWDAETSEYQIGDDLNAALTDMLKAGGELTYSEKRDTDSAEFKRWFGDSKLVDAEGNPLLLYHGTQANDIRVFKPSTDGALGPGIYLTESMDAASSYGGDGGVVEMLYARMEKPLVVYTGDVEPALQIVRDEKFWKENFFTAGQARTWARNQIEDWAGIGDEDFRTMLKDAGYDGVILKNKDTGEIVEAMVPSAYQVKSNLNDGEWSRSNPDIYASEKRTDTPEFKRWFGESKVVDGQGRPMVVYHNTSKDFAVFEPSDLGIHLGTTIAQAEDRAKVHGSEGNNTMPLYASIKNPLRLSDSPSWMDPTWSVERTGLEDYLSPELVQEARALKEKYKANRLAEGFRHDGSANRANRQAAMEVNRKIVEELKALGYDGIVYANTHDGATLAARMRADDSYVAFSPTQIKSAIGNQGTYDPENPDIRASAKRNIFGQQVLANWTAPTDSKLLGMDRDSVIYKLQDKQIDMKRVVDAIKSAVGSISDKWNAYLQEELYHGRTAKQTKDFLEDELKPLLQSMNLNKVSIADFEEYLHNRHAEERNIQIAKVNPKFPDGGSGIDTADARAYLRGLDPAKRKVYEALAKRADAISKETRELLVRSGLETRETIDSWEKAYKSYVPLFREDADFVSPDGMGSGSGFSVRGPASKRATGSSREVVDIMANLAMQRERAIVRAEKTRVATSLYGLAVQNPNTQFWLPVDPKAIKDVTGTMAELVNMGINPLDVQKIIQEPKETYIDPRTGLAMQRVNTALRNADNVLAVRINGEDKYLFFNNRDERAQRMVAALKNLDPNQLGEIMGLSAKVSRYFASINTQYNPIFGAINLIRDTQGAAFNLTTTPIADRTAQVMAGIMPAVIGIYADLRSRRAGKGATPGAWAQLWEEFQDEGGQTGFRDMFKDSTDRAKSLQAEIDQIAEGKLKQAGRGIFNWLSDYNETLENAVRLSAYKAGKDKGLSNQQAASIAKNLTVNFNRKGEIGIQAGALYAFFNASVQGTTRLAETLKGPAGKKILAGGLLLGVVQALALAAAGFKDDEPPDFIKERNLVIPTGDGKYITIPMPLGLHVIPNTSRVLTEWALSGWKNPTKRVAQITGAFLDAFNPIGNAGWSGQTITPTFADPLIALFENRDWTGKPIAKKDMSATKPTPGYTRAKDTASWLSKELSYYLNLATGGTKYTQGLLSPTPDQLDYLIGQVTGGVGREALKIQQAVESSFTGEELSSSKVPVLGRFYGDTKEQSAVSSRFFDNIVKLNEHENEIKGRIKNREGGLAEYRKDNPEAKLVNYANAVERDVSEMRRRKRELLAKNASPESIKILEERITRRMKQLNDRVEKAEDAPVE